MLTTHKVYEYAQKITMQIGLLFLYEFNTATFLNPKRYLSKHFIECFLLHITLEMLDDSIVDLSEFTRSK